MDESVSLNPRNLLAALLVGRLASWPSGPELAVDDVLAWLRHEGVLGLAELRLREGVVGVPEPFSLAFAAAARDEKIRSLEQQVETRRVLARLHEAGIQVLLLKGSALAWWAWPAPHLRACVDVDLLFASRTVALAAADLLAEDGYVRRQHFGNAATREFLCRRVRAGHPQVDLDLHWDLSSAPMFRSRFAFGELMAASIPLPALASTARGLGPVHALLHACMHRLSDLSHGGGDNLKWLYDLHLLAPTHGDVFATLAVERGLAGVCLDGLETAAALFGTPLPEAPLAVLHNAAAREPLDTGRLRSWSYAQRQNLRALPGWGERLRWAWECLWPSRHYREDVGVSGIGFVRDRFTRFLRRLRG